MQTWPQYARIGVFVYPFESSARRIAATRPSIMSDGATISAPARTCDRALAASHSSVASLSTSPLTIFPQCPWLVYSQLHTSVMTSRSGNSRLMARIARCTIPSSS